MRRLLSIAIVSGLLPLVFGASILEAGGKAAKAAIAAKAAKIAPSRIRGPVILNNPEISTLWTMPALSAAYGFPTKLAGGAVIGIAEYGGGYTQADLNLFSSTYMNGVAINVTAISVDGSVNSPGVDPDVDAEVALDIQIAAAAYYYCTGKSPTVKVFFASSGIADDDFVNNNAKVITAAANAGCDVLSISWGIDENFVSSSAAFALEAAATAATAKGMTIFCASGDGDATDQRGGEFGSLNHVSLPASCPHIVAVGGTTKTTFSEVVWNNGFNLGTSYPLGTGGGYSTLFPIQSWQVGAPVALPTNNGRGRMLPDVAANADPLTPYNIALGGTIQSAGNGTSAATPLWAGMCASFGKKLGFITPTLWATANRSSFLDVTQGNNILFKAAIGPDPCSGVGAPIGVPINALFIPAPPPPPVVPGTVIATFVAATNTLTLTGDAKANSVSVSYQAGVLKVQGGTATLIQTPTTAASTSYSTPLTGPLTLNVNLGTGDDAISLTGLSASVVDIVLGTGSDKVAVILSTITKLTITGGAATDIITTTSSKIGTYIRN